MANKEKPKNFKEAWEISGVALEVRVAKLLREMGWNVEVNQHYKDPYTGIPREIDLIVEKNYTVARRANAFNQEVEKKLQMRLFIECKYIKEIMLLFTKDRDQGKTMKALMNIMPYAKISEGILVSGDLIGPESHRYFKHNTVVHQSDDNGERGFGIKGAQQLFHGITSKTFENNVHYRIDYGVILVKDFSKIGVSYLGGEPTVLNGPSFFVMDYVDNTGKSTYSIADIVSEDGLKTFMLDREAEFELVKSSIISMEANAEMWKRIENTRREQAEEQDLY